MEGRGYWPSGERPWLAMALLGPRRGEAGHAPIILETDTAPWRFDALLVIYRVLCACRSFCVRAESVVTLRGTTPVTPRYAGFGGTPDSARSWYRPIQGLGPGPHPYRYRTSCPDGQAPTRGVRRLAIRS